MEGWSHCCTLVSNVTTVDFFICFINSVFSERGNKSNLSNGLRMVVYPVCFASEAGGCYIWSSDASVFVMIRPGGSVLWPPSSAIQCSVWPGVALHHDMIDPITFQKPKSKICRKE